MTQVSELYQTTKSVPFAESLSIVARKDLYRQFIDLVQPRTTDTILDVGVTCDQKHSESNFFEEWYPHKDKITCVGVEDASYLEKAHPGLRFVQTTPNQPLPFFDKQFDIVYSNAVLEHVGCRQRQIEFVKELCRVGNQVFLSVPNRLFPVEHHTALPFLHYLPNILFRLITRNCGLKFWADENNLNLFFPWKLKAFFPFKENLKIGFAGVGVGIFRSNVYAHFTEPKC